METESKVSIIIPVPDGSEHVHVSKVVVFAVCLSLEWLYGLVRWYTCPKKESAVVALEATLYYITYLLSYTMRVSLLEATHKTVINDSIVVSELHVLDCFVVSHCYHRRKRGLVHSTVLLWRLPGEKARPEKSHCCILTLLLYRKP